MTAATPDLGDLRRLYIERGGYGDEVLWQDDKFLCTLLELPAPLRSLLRSLPHFLDRAEAADRLAVQVEALRRGAAASTDMAQGLADLRALLDPARPGPQDDPALKRAWDDALVAVPDAERDALADSVRDVRRDPAQPTSPTGGADEGRRG